MKIRPARPQDVAQITACICEAFLPYVERIGKQPARGAGIGRQLLEFAEAQAMRLGHVAVDLMTHQLMVENRALYGRIGYLAQGVVTQDGYARVHYRKALRADAPRGQRRR